MSYTAFNHKLFVFIFRKGGPLFVCIYIQERGPIVGLYVSGQSKSGKNFFKFWNDGIGRCVVMIFTSGNLDRRSVKINKYSPVGIGPIKSIETVSHTSSGILVIFGGAGACGFVTD